MKILVTGAKGFIGKNLVVELKNRDYKDVFEYDIDTDSSLLDEYCKKADFVFHLAGVNRPENEEEFMKGNFGFTSKLLEIATRCFGPVRVPVPVFLYPKRYGEQPLNRLLWSRWYSVRG